MKRNRGCQPLLREKKRCYICYVFFLPQQRYQLLPRGGHLYKSQKKKKNKYIYVQTKMKTQK